MLDRANPKKQQRSKTAIAINYEAITMHLDALDPNAQLSITAELMRRLTKRIETIVDKIKTAHGEDWLER